LRKASSRPDIFLIALVLLMTIFGLIMVGDASVVEAYRDFGDKLYYLKLQAQWAGLGFLAFWLASLIHFRYLKKLAVPLMVFTIISLILVLIPGVGSQALGARRWLGVAGFRFQPAELAKFSLAVYLAALLSRKKQVLPFFILLGVLVSLVMLQPDLGTTVVLVTIGVLVYFVSGAPLWQISLIGILGVAMGIILIFSSSYRRQRVLTFLDPGQDPLGRSYHIRQVLIALGSGGVFGIGLGQSRQKYEYLPEVTTDSIFAVAAEETGFLGGSVILAAFLIFIWRGLRIARCAPDDFSRLLAVGVTSWIGLQAFVNLAAMVALLPLTGIPLPFISYGGSSLILALVAAGILVSISKYQVVKK